MGVLDGPCRNTPGDECNFGLHCHYYTMDGTSTSGRCVLDYNPYHPRHHTGNWNEPCNRPPVAPCNSDLLEGNWDNGSCMCRWKSEPRTGEAGGRCNKAPLAPCNHDNLQAHWTNVHVYATAFQAGQICTCEYLLGNSAPQGNSPLWPLSGAESTDDSNDDSADDDSSTGPSLGLRAPVMGVLDGPCRNTPGDECNFGLHCHYYTMDGTSTSGRCVLDYNPYHPRHHTGNWNEPCNRPPVAPCNSDLLEGNWDNGSCMCQWKSAPNTGEAGGRCNRSPLAPCNHDNLQAHWTNVHVYATAFQAG